MSAKKLFYSMGEVAEMFDVNPSLIRHWESKFDCLRPHKNKKGNRMFSPSDVEKLKQIYHLVKERGMTLEGANKAMKSSRGGISRDTELLERLQRIRAALEEVREELRDDASGEIVDADGVASAEDTYTEDVAAGPAAIEPVGGKVAAAEAGVASAASGAAAAPEGAAVAVKVAEPENVAANAADGAGAADTENAGGAATPEEGTAAVTAGDAEGVGPRTPSVGMVPAKNRTRRRRKGDDEDKELFPFYEQSLF